MIGVTTLAAAGRYVKDIAPQLKPYAGWPAAAGDGWPDDGGEVQTAASSPAARSVKPS